MLRFSGKVGEDGKFRFDDRARFDKEISMMRGAELEVEFTIKKKGSKRRRVENYLWGVVLKAISDHTGDEKEDLYEEYMCLKFPKFVDDEAAARGVRKTRLSSNELSDIEYLELVDYVKRHALNFHGLHIPSPGEYYEEAHAQEQSKTDSGGGGGGDEGVPQHHAEETDAQPAQGELEEHTHKETAPPARRRSSRTPRRNRRG